MNTFSRIKNDTASADVPFFKLEKGNDILKDQRSQFNYREYQQKYKAVCGVMPELDKVNNPVCAVLFDNVYMPEDIKKAQKSNIGNAVKKIAGGTIMTALTGQIDGAALGEGVGRLTGADWFPDFKDEYEEAVEKHKYAYSLISSYDFQELNSLAPCEVISSDNLGYKKTEDGIYYEGTWQNGELLYGMMYTPENGGLAFIGTFDENRMPDEGVMFDGDTYLIGLFKDGELECTHGLSIMLNQQFNGTAFACIIDAGGFEKGRRNGISYRYALSKSGEVALFGDEYDFGEVKKRGFFSKKLKPRGNTFWQKAGLLYYGFGCIIAGIATFVMYMSYDVSGSTKVQAFFICGAFVLIGILLLKKYRNTKSNKRKKK